VKTKRKLLSALLALVLVVGLSSPAFAATPQITGAVQEIDYLRDYDYSEIVMQTLPSSREVVYPLSAGMFDWSDGESRSMSAPVTRTQMNAASITLRVNNMPEDIFESIAIAYRTSSQTGGQTTACVVVKFKDAFVSTREKSFHVTVQLLRNRVRMSGSEIALQGTASNQIKTLTTNNSYVNISKGEVLEPTGTIRNLEIDLGNGVVITTPVYSNRKYYGTSSLKITEAHDKIINRFDNYLIDIVTLNTVGFNSIGGKPVMLEGYTTNRHVYGADGSYLGTTNNPLAYSDVYYVFNRQVDLSSLNLGGSSSGSSSSGSSSSSSAGTGSSSSGSGSGGTTTAAGTNYTTSNITSLANSAVTTAKNSKITTATVRVLSAQSITIGALQSIRTITANNGLGSSFIADTVSNNRVVGRITISPRLTTNLSSASVVKLVVDPGSTAVATTKSRFGNWFRNNMTYVSMSHQGNFGMTVSVAAFVDLSKLNTNKLRFYCYNPSTNKYREVTTTYRIDSNGYLHFSTPIGGDFVITDSALARR
jgi:Predicted membrane protein